MQCQKNMTAQEYNWTFSIFPTIILVTDLALRITLSARVVLKKYSNGTTFGWLIIILLLPFIGAILYLLVGENRIPERRVKRTRKSLAHYQFWLNTLKSRAPIAKDRITWQYRPLHRQAERLIGIPALDGNALEIIETPEEILNAIISDIDQARSSCHLQFYIWHCGGKVNEVEDALLKAAQRGVTCRILVDSIGSRKFISSGRASELRKGGVKIHDSLPAGYIKALFERVDIRNHRKIVVIDGEIAYTGSQNMVDPLFFKQDHGVGQWIDLMVRITGPVVESLAGTFTSDWYLESDDLPPFTSDISNDVADLRKHHDVHLLESTGSIPVQLVPSGPGLAPDTIHHLLLTAIYSARKEVILTTPYFVPDESLLTAIKSASHKGVRVVMIIPEKNDSKLVQYASRAHYPELMEAGVEILLFRRGLLHSKTITIDGKISLLGSVNLDMRSFWLNFEATLIVYDQEFTTKLRKVQHRYESQSIQPDPQEIMKRPLIRRFKENVALMIGPLL